MYLGTANGEPGIPLCAIKLLWAWSGRKGITQWNAPARGLWVMEAQSTTHKVGPMSNAARSPRLAHLKVRITDALREMGVLLMVFGPLEVTINRSGVFPFILLFGAGFFLFFVSLALEWRQLGD
jgi:hypothetical protein